MSQWDPHNTWVMRSPNGWASFGNVANFPAANPDDLVGNYASSPHYQITK